MSDAAARMSTESLIPNDGDHLAFDLSGGDVSSHVPTEIIKMTYGAIEWTYVPEPDGVFNYSGGDTLIHHSHPNDYLDFEDYDAGQSLHGVPGMHVFLPFSDFM